MSSITVACWHSVINNTEALTSSPLSSSQALPYVFLTDDERGVRNADTPARNKDVKKQPDPLLSREKEILSLLPVSRQGQLGHLKYDDGNS